VLGCVDVLGMLHACVYISLCFGRWVRASLRCSYNFYDIHTCMHIHTHTHMRVCFCIFLRPCIATLCICLNRSIHIPISNFLTSFSSFTSPTLSRPQQPASGNLQFMDSSSYGNTAYGNRCVCWCVCVCECVCVCVGVWMCGCVGVSINIYINIYIYMRIYNNICVHAHTRTLTHTHMHAHTHTHTHTHSNI